VLARPAGGWLSDRIGAPRVLRFSFPDTTALAAILAGTYRHMVPLTACCLTVAVALGLGTGAVFKLVPHWFPDGVGAVTAARGLAGFSPPLVMAIVKSTTGSYTLGFILLALVGVLCLAVLVALDRSPPIPPRATTAREPALTNPAARRLVPHSHSANR
jgi:MFS transporter, NNP family, nitrate/nitrite transporter